jgi:hypothetical protein
MVEYMNMYGSGMEDVRGLGVVDSKERVYSFSMVEE